MGQIRKHTAIGFGVDNGESVLYPDISPNPIPRSVHGHSVGLQHWAFWVAMWDDFINPSSQGDAMQRLYENEEIFRTGKGYAVQQKKAVIQVNNPSAPPPEYLQTYQYRHNPFPGAKIVGTAMRWRGYYSPVWGPWTGFPLHMPGTNPGFVAEVEYDITAVYPPYTSGAVLLYGYFDTVGLGRGVQVPNSVDAAIFTPPPQELVQLVLPMQQNALNAFNFGEFTGFGETAGNDNVLNFIQAIKFALY